MLKTTAHKLTIGALALALTASPSGAALAQQSPPPQCLCPQPAGTTRPANCLPCGSPISPQGTCGPSVQTASSCAMPSCSCTNLDATSYPPSCGCPATFDLVGYGASVLGIPPAQMSMTRVLDAARPVHTADNDAAIQAVVNQVMAGGGLGNQADPVLNMKFAAAINGLVHAPLLVPLAYSTGTVTDPDCEPSSHGVACSGQPIFTSFIINVHDFVNYDKSFAQVLELIRLHTAVDLPVFFYIDDQVLQAWVSHYSEPVVMALFSIRHDLVSAAYHTRVPFPYENAGYWGDWTSALTGTTGYFDSTRSQTSQAIVAGIYEALGVDTSDGLPSSHAGGYAYLKTLSGSAPVVVTNSSGGGTTSRALADVYGYLGAKLTVKHPTPTNGVTDICTKNAEGNLNLRPDSVNVKVYEVKTSYTRGDELFDDLLDVQAENWSPGYADIDDPGSPLNVAVQATVSKRLFLNFKWHDNNFYMAGTPWVRIYANDPTADTPVGSTGIGNGICNRAPDMDGDGIRDDWNGDGTRDVDDVAIAVSDAAHADPKDDACGLYHDNTHWLVSRGIDADTAEAECPTRNSASCDTYPDPSLIRERCKGYCGYTKTESQKTALATNYELLLAYVASNSRFRVLRGDDLASIAANRLICP